MSSDGLVHPRKIIRVYLTCPHITSWTTNYRMSHVTTSTWIPPRIIGRTYGRSPSDAPSAGHAQPPGLYDRPQQPSVYMTAYLGIHMCLTHGQTVSGPIASLDLWQLTISTQTCSHASSVGLWSLSSSNLVTSTVI